MLNQTSHLLSTPKLLPKLSGRTSEGDALEGEFRRKHLSEMLPVARVALSLGLMLAAVVMILDTLLPPVAGVDQSVSPMGVTVFLPLAAALLSTFWIRNRAVLPYVFIVAVVLVGAGSIVIAAQVSDPANVTAYWGVACATLFAYLPLGLTLRQGVLTGWPLFVAYTIGGMLFGAGLHLQAYSVVFLGFLNLIGTVTSYLLERRAREVFNDRRELRRMESTDGLTGLFNRRAFDQHVRRLWKQARREYEDVAVVVVDIDHFKLYNDCYGHQKGDDCINAIAKVLTASVHRPLDIVARYGGDEFGIVLYDPSESFLESFAHDLCQGVAALNVGHKGSKVAKCVTLSIGAAKTDGTGNTSAEQLMRQADDALYEAKSQGRNRAVVYRTEWGKYTTAHLAAALK